ncbi:hypothetical protein F4809DRAFT_642650 [Biscogniauxia mediterranea]|nr:hypothetical protein F4809DRAFT_642650 [Biscogniauxia mediterranea]
MSSDMNASISNLTITGNRRADKGPKTCPKCNLRFETRLDLILHQESQGHFPCDECDRAFHHAQDLADHKESKHRANQNITCPGCDMHFIRAAAWIYHIEELECPVIFPSTIEARRNERLKFAQALKELNPANSEKLYFQPHSVTKGDRTTKTHLAYDGHRPHDAPDANKVYFRIDDFPRTEAQKFRAGDSKQVDLLTGDDPDPIDQKPGDWGNKKDLFPNSHAAVPPPPELVENLRKPGPGASSLRPNGKRIIDPDHPDFNAAVFKNPILGTFKCPHLLCTVKPKTAKGLILHLRSPAHSEVDISCPYCKNLFKTLTAWVAHTESTSSCAIRDTPDYRPALAQVTGGILDIDPTKTLKNYTPVFKVDETFIKEMSYKRAAPTPGLEQTETAKNNKKANSRGGFQKSYRSRYD